MDSSGLPIASLSQENPGLVLRGCCKPLLQRGFELGAKGCCTLDAWLRVTFPAVQSPWILRNIRIISSFPSLLSVCMSTWSSLPRQRVQLIQSLDKASSYQECPSTDHSMKNTLYSRIRAWFWQDQHQWTLVLLALQEVGWDSPGMPKDGSPRTGSGHISESAAAGTQIEF